MSNPGSSQAAEQERKQIAEIEKENKATMKELTGDRKQGDIQWPKYGGNVAGGGNYAPVNHEGVPQEVGSPLVGGTYSQYGTAQYVGSTADAEKIKK